MTSERVRLCFFASLSVSETNLSGKRVLMILMDICVTFVMQISYPLPKKGSSKKQFDFVKPP